MNTLLHYQIHIKDTETIHEKILMKLNETTMKYNIKNNTSDIATVWQCINEIISRIKQKHKGIVVNVV